MTRLNLAQTCLLDVSGELGQKAKAQLDEHVKKYPAALVEHELIKQQFEMLRSLPKVSMNEEAKRQMASAIKQGIHRKLRQREQQAAAAKRWQLIHYAIATVSGMAACLVIGAAIMMVQGQQERERQLAAARAEEARQAEKLLAQYEVAGSQNGMDVMVNGLRADVDAVQEQQNKLANTDSSGGAAKLLDALDAVLDQAPTTDEPGVL